MLAKDGVKAFQLYGDDKDKKVVLTPVPVEGQPFTDALRAEIKESSNSEWAVQVQARTVAPVAAGDVLLATFYARSTQAQASGPAETQFVFERAKEPFTKSVTYPVALTPEWRKIQVRFASAEAYGPGEAQMIFRLGYDPETLEVGGVTVDNYGKNLRLAELPSTEAADRKLALKPAAPAAPLAAIDGGKLEFQILPSKVIRTISPYVYGVNSQRPGTTRPTVRRMGGNRQTAYNWENNASNAGKDWQHQSDEWPCTVLNFKNCRKPAGQMTDFVTENKQAGIESLLTIPLVDYVAADKNGPVAEKDRAPSKRFVRSYPRKQGGYAQTPDLKDGAVYQDELVNTLVRSFGKASAGGVRFYALDNEPALWPETHPRVHPDKTTYKEIVQRTEAMGAAITELDPTATVLGAVAFGWSEFMSLSSAPDAPAYNEKYGNYLSYFLGSLKQLEEKHHRRLVHVLDVHWYPEVKGTKRITENDESPKTIDARLSAPRSLWDPTFQERSWISDQLKQPIRLIPWLQEKVDKYYPGTKLGMTEYNYGSGDHISGGLAEADVLGIFGREGMFIANYWGNGPGVGDLPQYIAAAFKLYRNYDGRGSSFGDTAVGATVEDLAKASVYAATQSRQPGVLTVLAINKHQQANLQGHFKLEGPTQYTTAEVYLLDASSPEIKAVGSTPVKGNELFYPLPRLSATLFVLRAR
jgi:mannan endo-1,4-beta-mannosidase